MSVKKMSEIWELDLPQSEKLVALAFADHADDVGKCWPSLRRVAHKTGFSRRQVIRICQNLRARGILRRLKQGTSDSSVYVIDPSVGTQLKPLEISGGDMLTLPFDDGGCHGVTGGGVMVSPGGDMVTGGGDLAKSQGGVTQLCHPNHHSNHQEPSLAPSVLKTNLFELDGSPAIGDRELWDSLLQTCGISLTKPITLPARKAWCSAVKALKDVGATPTAIRARGRAFRTLWPHVSLTPTALARRWSECIASRSEVGS